MNNHADDERWELLNNLASVLDLPLTFLAFVWLVLVSVDLTSGLSPGLEVTSYVIWGIFIFEYALGLIIAPDRIGYVRRRWLGLIALLIPALRVLAFLRAFSVLQSLRLLRATSLARGFSPRRTVRC